MKRIPVLRLGIIYGMIIVSFFLVSYLTGHATTVIAQLTPLERNQTIIIDAGHGGIDGGATSCTGVLESKINLEISTILRDIFHLLGYQTMMTRSEDISIHTTGETIAAKKMSDLRNRARIVNETENGILISIHQNTFSDSRYSGAQVFYAPEGKELASIMQKSLVDNLNPGSNRASKRAEGVYLMEQIDGIGILVECGFLSNPEEEAKLRDPEYQKKLCSIIASSTAEFLTK